jgi:hypothetical protein
MEMIILPLLEQGPSQMLGGISNVTMSLSEAFKLQPILQIFVCIISHIKFRVHVASANFDHNFKSGQTFKPLFGVGIPAKTYQI